MIDQFLTIATKPWMWVGTLVLVVGLIVVDQVSYNRKADTVYGEITGNQVEAAETEELEPYYSELIALVNEFYSQYYYLESSLDKVGFQIRQKIEEQFYVIESVPYLKNKAIGKDEITFHITESGEIEFISINHLENKQLSEEVLAYQASEIPLGLVDLSEGITHIEPLFYDQFEWWNQIQYYNTFQISEKYVDGELSYCFMDYSKQIMILVDAEQSKATVRCKNGTFSFDVSVVLSAIGSSVGNFYVKDATGDGGEDLIYLYGNGGTGVWESHVRVFSLETLKEYEVQTFIPQMADFIQVEVQDFSVKDTTEATSGGQVGIATYKITDALGGIHYGESNTYMIGDTLPVYCPESQSEYYEINWNEELNRFDVSVSVAFENSRGNYFGSVDGFFIFDESTQSFQLGEELSFRIYE